MFDEYGGGTNMRRRDEHFLVLKSMYDASGSTRAVFSNDNRVHKMHIRSGSIFTSCSKPTEEEAINRCVFVNLDGLSDSKDSMAYENELGGDQRNDLSSFIIIASMRATWPMYMKHYNIAIKNVYNYTANNQGGQEKLCSRSGRMGVIPGDRGRQGGSPGNQQRMVGQ